MNQFDVNPQNVTTEIWLVVVCLTKSGTKMITLKVLSYLHIVQKPMNPPYSSDFFRGGGGVLDPQMGTGVPSQRPWVQVQGNEKTHPYGCKICTK